MNVTREDLNGRLGARTNEELQAIATDLDSVYTDQAREEARCILARRIVESNQLDQEPQTSDLIRPSHATSYVIEDAILEPARAIRRWWYGLLPDHIPAGIRRLFGVGVSSAVPATVTALVALIEYFLFSNTTGAFAYLASSGGVYLMVVGVAGLCLAYGVKTERAYPQYLAAGVVGLAACVAILDELRAGSISAGMYVIAAAAYATVEYLLRSPEATQYYKRIRHRAA